MKKPAVLGLFLLLAALAPAFAGTVYIPVASQRQIGSVVYRTEVVVANPGTAAGRITTTLGTTSSSVTVRPGGTSVLTGVIPSGRDGLLAVSGSPGLAVTARLVAASRSGRVLARVQIPAIGEPSLIPAGETAQIQGIGRVPGTVHVFGLVHLGAPGADAASCEAAVFRADGSMLGKAVRFTAPEQALSTIAALQAALGRATFSDARLQVACDSPVYPFVLQLGARAVDTAFLGPSTVLEEPTAQTTGELGRDGNDDPPGATRGGEPGDDGGSGDGGDDAPVPPAGDGPEVGDDGSLTYAGSFFNPRNGDSYRAFELPLRPGVRYRTITVEFDLLLDKWQSPLFHCVTSLRRSDRVLYYGLIVRGDKAKTVLDLGRDQLARGDGPWAQRTNYHVRMVTDARSHLVTLQLFQGGTLVHTVSGRMTTRDLMATAQNKIKVDFGIGRVADGAYFPPIGWRYSNLEIQAETF